MLQENLQINIGANTQDLQAGLNQATNSVNNFSASVQKAGKPTADATQSLVNLSRVAQDAPYGFMGIANNLNPLLESFQRLQKEAGSSGAALQAMGASLAGPAGIGLALGVVSSLIVTFGGKISEFFSNLTSDTGNLNSFNEALKGIGNTFTSAAEKVDKVSIAFQEYHNGILSGNEALKIYNDELGKNFGIKSNINEAEDVFKNKTAAYVEASLQRALADSASKKAAEELLKQKLEAQKAPEEYRSMFDISGAGVGGGPGVGVNTAEQARKAQLARQKENLDEQQKIIDQYRKIAYDASAIASLYEKGFDFNLRPDKSKSTSNKEDSVNYGEELLKEMKRAKEFYSEYKDFFNSLGGPILMDTPDKIRKDEEKRLASIKPIMDNLKKQMDQTGLGSILGKKADELGEKFKAEDALAKENAKTIKEQEEAYKSFANTISNEVTNGLMTMFDAMQKGENPLQALGNFFADLVKQMAAAVIQAVIFQSIMTALGFGGVPGTGGGGGGFLGKLFGFAEGGIVSRPTVAMVGEGGQSEAIMPLNKLGNMLTSTFQAGAMNGNAGGDGGGQFVLKGSDLVLAMQRSNFSLNVRR